MCEKFANFFVKNMQSHVNNSEVILDRLLWQNSYSKLWNNQSWLIPKMWKFLIRSKAVFISSTFQWTVKFFKPWHVHIIYIFHRFVTNLQICHRIRIVPKYSLWQFPTAEFTIWKASRATNLKVAVWYMETSKIFI